MSYFAELDESKNVVRVIVADAAFVAKLGGTWVETFMDAGYAGVGYKYDKGAFTKKVDSPTGNLPV